jgi:serine/threonine-protein kinase haspin
LNLIEISILNYRTLPKCRKIGEGVYGEVFLNEGTKSSFVLKIIPIEGEREVNGSQQKKFDEILQEVIISQELSALRNDKENRSAGFVEVLSAHCVEGRYPDHLCALWKEYRDNRGTENDDPKEVFSDDQLYVVFELANCGLDLEAYQFKNAEQSYSVFKQVRIFGE